MRLNSLPDVIDVFTGVVNIPTITVTVKEADLNYGSIGPTRVVGKSQKKKARPGTGRKQKRTK